MNNNDKISLWMGRPCSCVTEIDSSNLVRGIPQPTTYWGNCAMHGLGGLSIPWETSERRAVELLSVLVEKGYWVELKHFNIHKWRLDMGDYSPAETLFGPKKPTIAEAITSAILKHIIDPVAESI
jgi:hypothetical protein